MIVGVAAKVVPTLNGMQLEVLSPLWGPFVLINLGCALRVVGQTLTDFTATAFPFAGVSGLLEVAGLAMWGTHLWLIMAGKARIRRRPETPQASDSLATQHTPNGHASPRAGTFSRATADVRCAWVRGARQPSAEGHGGSRGDARASLPPDGVGHR